MSRIVSGGITGKLFALCDRLGFAVNKKIKENTAAEESCAEASFIGRTVSSVRFRRSLLHIKTSFAAGCENSVILNFLRRLMSNIMRLSARSISSFCVSFSLSSAAVIFLKYILYGIYPTYTGVTLLLVFLFASVALAFSEKSIYGLLAGSTFFSGLTSSVYVSDGIRYGETVSAAGVLLFAGMSAGFLSYFTGVFLIPAIIAIIVFIAVIFVYPEKGTVLTLLAVPFLGLADSPSVTLAAAVMLIMTSYLFKFLRGKRTGNGAKANTAFIILLTGTSLTAFSAFSSSLNTALLTAALMLGYPMAIWLVRNLRTAQSVVTAIAVSSCVIAAVGVLQYIQGVAPLDWLDTELFSSISGRAVSLFGNPNILGAYLTVVFPFGLHLVVSGQNPTSRALGFISVILTVACGIFTWSRSCWIGLFAGFALYVFFMTPRSLVIIPLGLAMTGGICAVFNDTVGKRLLNLVSLSDHANSYRVSVWNGALEAFRSCFFTGNGAGEIAFRNIYMQFCTPGTESAPHSHSIYLQIGISGGIFLLAAFIGFAVTVLRRSLRVCAAAPHVEMRSVLAASVASFTAMLGIGIVDNVFYNYRIMFMFFFVAGLAVSASSQLKNGMECSHASFAHSGQVTNYLE